MNRNTPGEVDRIPKGNKLPLPNSTMDVDFDSLGSYYPINRSEKYPRTLLSDFSRLKVCVGVVRGAPTTGQDSPTSLCGRADVHVEALRQGARLDHSS
jgi:hypothetical protein